MNYTGAIISIVFILFQWFYFEFQQLYTVQPMTGIEGFKYLASDGYGSVIHFLFVRDFAAMGCSSFNPHAQFIVHSAE